MNRRNFLKSTGLILGSLPFLNCSIRKGKPNILLIITDDQGYADYSAYGGADDVNTPNMDKISQAGIRFTNAYASSPICSASRAAIITGSYQQRWGTYYYGGNIFPQDQPTIPELLKKDGYRCLKIGKNHYARILDNNEKIDNPTKYRDFPLNHGYDYFLGFCAHRHDYFKLREKNNRVVDSDDDRMSQFGPLWKNKKKKDFDGYTTNIFGDEAVKQIKKKGEKPFFMELSFNSVHHPIYQAPKKYLEKFGIEKFPEWDPDKESFLDYHARTCWRDKEDPVGRKRYLANLACLDDNIGKVLNALEETGKMNNTMIFLISDNGGSQNTYANNGKLKGHKYILREGGIRTIFTMCWLDNIKKNQIIDIPISHMDILPTCLSATDSELAHKNNFDGKSLFPVIANSSANHHKVLVWDTGNEWAVRKGDWKLHIVKKDNHFRTINIDAGTYLYNLKSDPGEKVNLAKKLPNRIKDLKNEYKKWKKSL